VWTFGVSLTGYPNARSFSLAWSKRLMSNGSVTPNDGAVTPIDCPAERKGGIIMSGVCVNDKITFIEWR